MHFRSWIEISKKNLLHNFSVFKKLTGNKVKVACVIKANAYGHGLTQISSILKDKADLLAVDSLNEALSLRISGIEKKILILGYIPTFDLEKAIQNDFSFVFYNFESLKRILSIPAKRVAKVHLKIETGLNRQGIKISDLKKFLDIVKENSDRVEIEGVYTHFANIEDTLDTSFADSQVAILKEAVKILKTYGMVPKYIHAAASAATILYPNTYFNLVRLGISLYGLWPSREVRVAAKTLKREIELKPVLSWKGIVAQVKTIKKGETVGYGRSWIAPRDSKIAVIPVGYFDGFDRKLSNTGTILVNGKYAPVIGRVAMNMFMVDITEIGKVSVEGEVTLIGKSGQSEITIDMVADKLDRIDYEVVTRINPNLPRVIV